MEPTNNSSQNFSFFPSSDYTSDSTPNGSPQGQKRKDPSFEDRSDQPQRIFSARPLAPEQLDSTDEANQDIEAYLEQYIDSAPSIDIDWFRWLCMGGHHRFVDRVIEKWPDFVSRNPEICGNLIIELVQHDVLKAFPTYENIVLALIRAGAPLEDHLFFTPLSPTGEFLLHAVCFRGFSQLFKELVEKACTITVPFLANLNCITTKERTPLFIVNSQKQTLMHLACLTGNMDNFHSLASIGISETVDTYGYTPLDYACKFNYVEIINNLMENPQSKTPRMLDLNIAVTMHMEGNSILNLLLHKGRSPGFDLLQLDQTEISLCNRLSDFPLLREKIKESFLKKENPVQFLIQNPSILLECAQQAGRSVFEIPLLFQSEEILTSLRSQYQDQDICYSELELILTQFPHSVDFFINYIKSFKWKLELSRYKTLCQLSYIHVLRAFLRGQKLQIHDKLTILGIVCEAENEAIIKAVLEFEHNVNFFDTEQGLAPLHIASLANNAKFGQLLIDYGAFLEPRDINGNTPLHLACQKGHVDMVKFLISQKANLQIKNRSKMTPAEIAFQNGHIEIVAILLENGATFKDQFEVMTKTKNLEPLDVYFEKLDGLREFIKSRWPSETSDITLFLATHFQQLVIIGQQYGWTPLELAFLLQSSMLAKALIEKILFSDFLMALETLCKKYPLCSERIAKIFAINRHTGHSFIPSEEKTWLQAACVRGCVCVIEILILKGATVNWLEVEDESEKNLSLLGYAFSSGQSESAKVLLSHGAFDYSIKKLSIPIETFYQYIKNFPSLVSHLKEMKIEHVSKARKWIKANLDQISPFLAGSIPLELLFLLQMFSVARRRLDPKNLLEQIEVLSQHYPYSVIANFLSIDTKKADRLINKKMKTTYLQLACQLGYAHAVQFLLSCRVEIEAANKHGKTALHIACKFGHKHVVEVLLAAGANFNATTLQEDRPLDFANQSGSFAIARLLFTKGATTNRKGLEPFIDDESPESFLKYIEDFLFIAEHIRKQNPKDGDEAVAAFLEFISTFGFAQSLELSYVIELIILLNERNLLDKVVLRVPRELLLKALQRIFVLYPNRLKEIGDLIPDCSNIDDHFLMTLENYPKVAEFLMYQRAKVNNTSVLPISILPSYLIYYRTEEFAVFLLNHGYTASSDHLKRAFAQGCPKLARVLLQKGVFSSCLLAEQEKENLPRLNNYLKEYPQILAFLRKDNPLGGIADVQVLLRNPQALIHIASRYGFSILEFVFFLQSPVLARKIASFQPLNSFWKEIQLLCAKYPLSLSPILDIFFTQNLYHFKLGNESFRKEFSPIENNSYHSFLTEIDLFPQELEKYRVHVHKFFERLENRSREGVPRHILGHLDFIYESMQRALANVYFAIKTYKPDEKRQALALIFQYLSFGSENVGLRYFFTPILLYQTFCTSLSHEKNFPIDLYEELRQLRISTLGNLAKEHSKSEIKEFLSRSIAYSAIFTTYLGLPSPGMIQQIDMQELISIADEFGGEAFVTNSSNKFKKMYSNYTIYKSLLGKLKDFHFSQAFHGWIKQKQHIFTPFQSDHEERENGRAELQSLKDQLVANERKKMNPKSNKDLIANNKKVLIEKIKKLNLQNEMIPAEEYWTQWFKENEPFVYILVLEHLNILSRNTTL